MTKPALELAEKCLEENGFIRDPLWGNLTASSWLASGIRINVYDFLLGGQVTCCFWRDDARLGDCDVYDDECDTLETYLEKLSHDRTRKD